MDYSDLELRYRDLFENTNDLIHFVGTDDRIISTNSAWLKTLGYQADEVVGKCIYDFIHPEHRPAFERHRQAVIGGAGRINTTIVFRGRHGSVVAEGQISCTVSDGQCLYTRGVFRDITRQREIEEQLESSRKRLTAFFDSAPDAVVVINEDDIIQEWNPKATEIFGFSQDEVVGRPLVETIIPLQYREAHKRGMAHFIKTGEGPVLNKTIEITALHKSGREFYVSLSISSVLIESEWLFVAFISDISERKQIEQQLIRKEAELMQSRVLDEKKDEFLGIASHELKTPLTTVKAYLQLALFQANQADPSGKIVNFLRKANVNTDKLTYLINELLDVTKIQQGKLNLSLAPVDFDQFLQELLVSLQFIVPKHRLEYEGCPSCLVKIDALRMEQVITNFISNAAKYSPGQDLIKVKCKCLDGEVILAVQDFGIGIPKEEQRNLFSRFYRVENIETGFSGLGIGLFIAKEIVKQHGGSVWVESEPGGGSTFYMSIPRLIH